MQVLQTSEQIMKPQVLDSADDAEEEPSMDGVKQEQSSSNIATSDPSPNEPESVPTDTANESTVPTTPDALAKREESSEGETLEALEEFETGDSDLPITGLTAVAAPQTKSVQPKRKEELLLKARADRLKWIQKVALPYKKRLNTQDPWNQDESLVTFRSTHAARELPTALPLLAHLYGTDDTGSPLGSRIETLLKEDSSSKDKVLPSGDQILSEEMQERTDIVLEAYHEFWTRLSDPACAMLVQGMRNFCQKLQNLNNAQTVGSKLKAYLESTLSALKSHVAWKGQTVDEQVRRSLESFIYGHVYSHLESIVWNKEAQSKDKEWLDRLTSLQFVQPEHLEIACLHSSDNDLDDLLKAPIDTLLSVDCYYSPFEKLQGILAVYRSVNAALSEALNRRESQKLPSADDVLPTMILVLLKAKPSRLLVNLQMIEDWSPPEYLRGEAGYAYTNLYGAVHFLQDLDLTNEDATAKSLHISPQDLRQGLKACQVAVEEHLATKRESAVEQVLSERSIPPHEIRAARLRGETVDLEWARTWQKTHDKETSEKNGSKSRSAFDEAAEGLPEGFSRNYTFLTSSPEDIKLSDLPQLLAEYRMLVHATESLIGDRAAKITAARKAKAVLAQKDLFERVRQVDPSLLPPTTNNGSSSKSRKHSF